ncbi:hypothetical protein [Mesorhizobium sp. B2-3-12]|uniref:hypothetical protein n=1 Tax=Mesorhizobium sp. B2-3-12 TaxID=2589952 RepID=UPI001129ECA2|nr:hypothetical protein [Mesorhizobium sp. B2-3-12]TPL87137.1 hypothetical protein FJ948_21835 [Mesorhizobium sp. B2-3-12]
MSISVNASDKQGGVDVPTMEEFNNLVRRVAELEAGVIKTTDKISLMAQGELLTWITQGGEVKSRATDYIPQFQGWTVVRR